MPITDRLPERAPVIFPDCILLTLKNSVAYNAMSGRRKLTCRNMPDGPERTVRAVNGERV